MFKGKVANRTIIEKVGCDLGKERPRSCVGGVALIALGT
jgi:hypothetical protein